jgi:hypothetical protein
VRVETGELASYALVALGFAAIAWAGWSSTMVGIDREAANAVLMKLLAAGNHERARKLCAATSGSYLDAVGAALDAAASSPSRDLTTLDALVLPAFDAKGVAVAERWRGIIERGLLGAMLVLGGAGLALSAGGPLPLAHEIASGLALVCAVWFLARRRAVTISLETARREVVPAAIKAIIDGPRSARDDESGPFRVPGVTNTPPAEAVPSLRDGRCPLCAHTQIRQLERADPRFSCLVCSGCGYTQEFADLAKLG